MQSMASQTFQMIQCGNLDLDFPIKHGILLLGQTKAGKTTTSHYLTRQLLVGDYNQAQSIVYRVQKGDSKYANAYIGLKESQSETQIPNMFSTNLIEPPISLIDCPGYLDTYGCSRVISNGYFHFKVFSKVEHVKFILTVQYSDFDGVATNLRQTFKAFYNGFRDFSIDKENILGATCLLVTKVPKTKDHDAVLKRFRATCPFKTGTMKQAFTIFQEHFLEKNKIFIFHAAQIGKKCNNENLLLNQINNATTFWKRELDNRKQPNLENIKISIRDRILKRSQEDEDFQAQLSQIGQYFRTNLLENKLKKYDKVMKTLAKESFGEQKDGEFLIQIDKYVKQEIQERQNTGINSMYNKYSSKRQENLQKLCKMSFINEKTSSVQSSPIWLKKITIIENLYKKIDVLVRLSSDQQYQYSIKGIEEYCQIVIESIKLVINLVLANYSKDNKNVLKFGYDIYSLIETSYSFFKILKDKSQLQNINSPLGFILTEFPFKLKDTLYTLISNESLIKKKMNFALNIDLTQKSNFANTKQFQPIMNFYRDLRLEIQHILSNDLNCEFNNIQPAYINGVLEDLKFKQITLGLQTYSIQYERISSSNLNISKTLQIVKQVQEIRQQIEEIFQRKQNQLLNQSSMKLKLQRVKCISLLASFIMKIPGKQSEMLALDLYEFVNDSYIIMKYYAQKQNDIKKKNINGGEYLPFLIRYAREAVKFQFNELAKNKLAEATHWAVKEEDERAIKMITDLKTKVYFIKEDAESLSDSMTNMMFENYSAKPFNDNLTSRICDLFLSVNSATSTPGQSPTKKIWG